MYNEKELTQEDVKVSSAASEMKLSSRDAQKHVQDLRLLHFKWLNGSRESKIILK